MDLAVPLPPDTLAAFDLEALLDRAFRLADRGDVRAGRVLAEQALAEARSRSDRVRTARALTIVANASRVLADYDRAAAAALESVGLLESAGSGLAAAKIDLALVFFDLGDYPRALSHLLRRSRTSPAPPTDGSKRDARTSRDSCNRASTSSTSRGRRSNGRSRFDARLVTPPARP